MAIFVLGAPGSGKTTARGALAQRLPDRVVMDWDDLMEPAGALAGADVRDAPATWAAYRALVRALVDVVGPRLVLLGVCTPDELSDWPLERWLLLDCADEERRRRIAERSGVIDDALVDAAAYRALGIETIDSTGLTPATVAARLAAAIRQVRTRPATLDDVDLLTDIVIEATRAQGRWPADVDEVAFRRHFAASTEAQVRGVEPLELSVEHDNPQARALYERLGFVLVGEDSTDARFRWHLD